MDPAKELDLRDWYAGQALVGILMSPHTPRPEAPPFSQHAASLAEQAFAYADAMIKERSRQGGEAAPERTPNEAPGAFGPEGLAAEKSAGVPSAPTPPAQPGEQEAAQKKGRPRSRKGNAP